MIQQHKILIADSDAAGNELTVFYLTQALFDTRTVTDPEKLSDEYEQYQPDLILLEADFPEQKPFEACRLLRQRSDIPILMLARRCEVSDRVRGLNLGADDYLVKPYDARELIARIHALLRRTRPQDSTPPSVSAQTGEFVEYPDLIINITNYSIIYKGKYVETPPKELELFYFLASSPNQVFSREQLLDRLWGYDYMGETRTVDVHIKRLREKFKGNRHWAIKTVWSVGYKFEVK